MSLDPALLHAATRHLRGSDPVLAELIERVGPCLLRVDRRGSRLDRGRGGLCRGLAGRAGR